MVLPPFARIHIFPNLHLYFPLRRIATVFLEFRSQEIDRQIRSVAATAPGQLTTARKAAAPTRAGAEYHANRATRDSTTPETVDTSRSPRTRNHSTAGGVPGARRYPSTAGATGRITPCESRWQGPSGGT